MESPVIKFMSLIYHRSWESGGESYRRLNSGLNYALSAAISTGMKFDRDDFDYITKYFGFYHWCGQDRHMSGERYYQTAIESGNISAAISFERAMKRKAFLYGIPKKRLYVYARFTWKSEQVTATSISEDGIYLIACSYHPREKHTDPNKVKKTYRLTPKDLIAETKYLKKLSAVYKYCKTGSTFINWVVRLCEASWPKEDRDATVRRITEMLF